MTTIPAFSLRILCFPFLVVLGVAHSQQPMGTVATHDALVTGGLQVQGERAQLLTNVSVTAYDRTAPIDLARGGEVLVCSTSQFHMLRGGGDAALFFGLDRGAIEIHGRSQPQDVIQTPDLRFTLATQGELDLRLRVTPNGDTCVENAGASAPQLAISDAFSDAGYVLRPGQHVLFEHGSLKEVVDNERSACGCPSSAPATQLAQATNSAAAQAAASNPFPEAVSQGLAPEAKPMNAAPVGETRTQISSTIAFGGDSEVKTSVAAPPAAPVQTVSTAPPPSPPGAHDIAHAIARFFRRLFGGSGKPASAPGP